MISTAKLLSDSTLSQLLMAYLKANCRIEQSTRDLTASAFGYLEVDSRVSDFGYNDAECFQGHVAAMTSDVTANIYVKTVRPVFRWAIRQGVISEDPFGDLRLFRIAKKRIRVFEPWEFAALLDSCPGQLWRARFLLAKTAGLRRGEILNLTIEDIDFNKGVIYVQPKKETSQTWRWVVKDKDRKELPLVDEVAKLLTELMLDLPEGQPYLLITPGRYQRIMELRAAGRLPDRVRKCPDENWSKPVRRIFRKAEVRTGTFHDLRRTFVTEMLESGLQPHEVMKLAGHQDLETTLTYYVATRRSLLSKARKASTACLLGATGLEPATS